ncbi:hypothetical protein [Erwinia rhapontici]|uniref:hypothetical protein n=1 Tax=Erwinia rhapontici TaxID=55212 RepID=UPI001BB3E0EF|nr:hypothetical protein [Erwinia rhapontici]
MNRKKTKWNNGFIILAIITVLGGLFFRELYSSLNVMVLTILFVPLSYLGALCFKGDKRTFTELLPDLLVCVSLPSVIYDALKFDESMTTGKIIFQLAITVVITTFYFFKLNIMADRKKTEESVAESLLNEKINRAVSQQGAWTVKIDYAELLNRTDCTRAEIDLVDDVIIRMFNNSKISLVQASMKWDRPGGKINKIRTIHKRRVHNKNIQIDIRNH